VYLTAHVSAETRQLVERRGDVFHDNLGRYLAGQPLRYVCDLERGY
jgi:phosphoglycerate dehydrogenase-like enzyme